MVPVNVNSKGLNEVVKSLKKYRKIKSTSNCPEKGSFVGLNNVF